MRIRAILLSILLLSFALPLLEAKFTEKLTVQVFDQLYRTVEGAEIYAEYQLNSISGTTRSKPKATNASGTVGIVIVNYEEIGDSTKYAYTLYVKYGNVVNSTSLIANANATSSSRVVTLMVPSYYVFVYVRDQNGKPLSAEVSIDERKRITDEVGAAIFQLPQGNFTVRAESASAVGTATISNLKSDQSVSVEIGLYNLQVRVTDDSRKPLNATVEVGDLSVETDAAGMATFENLSFQMPQVIVKHAGSFRRFTPNLRTSPKLDAVFDLHKPLIKELHASVSKTGVGTVSLFAEDPGSMATGIGSVSVTYEANGVEGSVPAYSIGYSSFEAKIASQLPKTVVKYLVRVTDNEGNTASEAGTYVVFPDEPPPVNGTNGVNVTNGTGWNISFGKIPVEAIIIGVIVGAIVIFAAAYYFMKMRRAVPPQPPVVPPIQPQEQ